MRQRAAQMRFGIADHRGIVDMMDQPRRDTVEMRHQPHIIDIALPDMLEREGGGVGAREALVEGRKAAVHRRPADVEELRSDEHTSELQSLMRISYAVVCLTKN